MSVTDLLTFDEAVAAIDKKTDTIRDDITALITAVSRLIDRKCGPVVIRSVSEQHEARQVLMLRQAPVAVVTTINSDAYDPAVHQLDRHGFLRLRSCGWFVAAPSDGWVTVAYTAGRVASTVLVADHFKTAAKIALRDIWKREFSGVHGKPSVNASDPAVVREHKLPLTALQVLVGEIRYDGIA